MTTPAPTWQELFRQQRHALLGQMARSARHAEVHSLADEETLLVGEASVAARLSPRPQNRESVRPRSVVLTPASPQQTLREFQSMVDDMRRAHPQAEMAGFGPLAVPANQRYLALDRGVALVGRAAQSFEPADDLDSLHGVRVPLTAVLIYTPEVTPEALEQVAVAVAEIPDLLTIVPLPAGAGDRIPLPGLTTAGSTDMMVISALRLLLPRPVRVRASWAALGWKVAQVALGYGADEIAGWTAAETLAYTGRVRAASRVDRQELDEGLAEARCGDAGWFTQSRGGYR